MCRQSVRAAQPVLAGPDLLPRANDATARLHLHRGRDQESRSSLHAMKRDTLHSFHATSSHFSFNHIKLQNVLNANILLNFMFVLSSNK